MGAKNIISRSSDIFSSRDDAAKRLTEYLMRFRVDHPVVLGIPRGGVIIAEKIALALGGDLDVVLSHKLGAPANPELAIGAVCEDGTAFIDEKIASAVAATDEYIERERLTQLEVINQRVDAYRKILHKTELSSRTVIVTDDGVATGATMKAALWAVRKECPKKLIAALPVGPSDTIEDLAEIADEVICLETPPYFSAIGQFYSRFDQVENEEVLKILEAEHQRRCKK